MLTSKTPSNPHPLGIEPATTLPHSRPRNASASVQSALTLHRTCSVQQGTALCTVGPEKHSTSLTSCTAGLAQLPTPGGRGGCKCIITTHPLPAPFISQGRKERFRRLIKREKMPNLCPQRQAFNKLENYRLWPCIKKVPPTPVVLHTHTHNEILLSRCLLKQHAEKKCLATAKHFLKKRLWPTGKKQLKRSTQNPSPIILKASVLQLVFSPPKHQ